MTEQASQSETPDEKAPHDAVHVGANDPWQRLLYMIGFGVVAYALLWLIMVLALVQFVLVLVNRSLNTRLVGFAGTVNRYFAAVTGFLTFTTDRVPPPFSPMAAAEEKPSSQAP